MNRYYPVFLDLKGKNVLVVGSGPMANKKAAGLRRAGAKVRVVPAPSFGRDTPSLTLPQRGGNYSLVVVATDDPRVQAKVSVIAKRMGILCNVMDRADLSSFISPSVLRRGDLAVAVSTGGASPALARWIRKDIEKGLGKGYPGLLRLMKSLRPRAKRSIPSFPQRKRYYEDLFKGKFLTLALQGRLKAAREEALRKLGTA